MKMEVFSSFFFLGILMGVREVSMRRGVTETRKGRPMERERWLLFWGWERENSAKKRPVISK